MWKPFSLRARIMLILSFLGLITLGGGSVMLWYTSRMQSLFSGLVSVDIATLQGVEELEKDLASQKVLVSYYFLTGDSVWLEQLEELRQSVRTRLRNARASVLFAADRKLIDQIEEEYNKYKTGIDNAIVSYKTGAMEEGTTLNREVRLQFFKVRELCDYYKNTYYTKINVTRNTSGFEAKRLRIITVSAMSAAIILGALLTGILLTQILRPLRKLALETDDSQDAERTGDEIVELSHRVRGLIRDMDSTKIELERSREHLVQAEKLASVGKLAAGVAHTIRNPLTSVKMRLFSLERNLHLSPTQKEDFEVVSEEIRRIDTIVQNFLEFSRPPKLKMQEVSLSDVVDNVIQLLRHRLDSYNVKIKVNRRERLPEILADPKQLQEVFVNLSVNACEAMTHGGEIAISEEAAFVENMGQAVVIRLSDNGPGIPSSIQENVFQPFFSTKEEGTGLGLPIAARIITKHGGWINVESEEGKGTTFIITLPVIEEGT